MSLNGEVAIVASGTKDVGRGIAADLARQGVHVFVTGRSAPDHRSIGEQTTEIRCDHCIDSEVEAAFKFIRSEVEAIDILVNNIWDGYERMMEDGKFTWSRPFWEKPLWRSDV